MKKYFSCIALALVWAVYYEAAGVANKAASPFTTGTLIRFITFLLLTLRMLKHRELKQLVTVGRALPLLLLVGAFGFMLDVTAFLALQHSSSGIGTILLKTDVLMVNIASIFIYKIKIRRRDWLLTILMLLGICILLNISPVKSGMAASDLLFIASAAFVTANALLIKHIQSNYSVADNTIAYYNNLVTMALFTVVGLLGGYFADDIPCIREGAFPIAVAIAGLGQFLIYALYYSNLRRHPVWIVKIILLLIPVFSSLADVLLFHQSFTLRQLVGGAIILACAIVLLCGQREKSEAISN